MSTNTVANNPTPSSVTTPKAAKTAVQAAYAATATGAFKKSKKKFKVVEENSPQWNFSEYLMQGYAGIFAGNETGIFKWVGTHWQAQTKKDGSKLTNAFIHAHCAHRASNSTVDDAWKYAGDHLAHHHPLPSPKGSPELVVPCLNGYVHIDQAGSITVKPADRALGLTYAVNATIGSHHGKAYQPSAVPAASMFGKFLASALPDPQVRALVQEQCALTLIQGPHQIAFWWFGTGGNGKGVMTSLLKNFHQTWAQVWLNKLADPTHLAGCINASLLLTPEVKRGQWDEEQWKALTGGDPLMAKLLYKDLVPFTNRAVHIISSNDKAFITDVSDAVYRRLCFVEWVQTAGSFEKIDNLDQKIMATESHLFLDWLLEGLQRIAQRGNRFMPESEWPESVRALKTMIRATNDCIGAWADACNVVGVDPDAHGEMKLTPKTHVYASYEQWCRDDGRLPLAENIFWRKIWNVPRFRAYQPQTARGYTMRYNDKQVNAARLRLHAPSVKPAPTAPSPSITKDIVVSGTGNIHF